MHVEKLAAYIKGVVRLQHNDITSTILNLLDTKLTKDQTTTNMVEFSHFIQNEVSIPVAHNPSHG
jgi:hypothetical protein